VKTRWPVVLKISVVACSLLIAIQILRWWLISILTVFLEPLVEIAAAIFFIVAFIWSLIAFIRLLIRRQRDRHVFVSLGLCAITIVIVWFVPFNNIMLKANFHIFLKKRTHIAQEIVDRKWDYRITNRGGRGDWINLPETDRVLSDDGELAIWREGDQILVMFFTFRGVLDSFSGFVYSSNDTPPKPDAFLGTPIQIERWVPHWYWYASRN
jgi:hypothetical protein